MGPLILGRMRTRSWGVTEWDWFRVSLMLIDDHRCIDYLFPSPPSDLVTHLCHTVWWISPRHTAATDPEKAC